MNESDLPGKRKAHVAQRVDVIGKCIVRPRIGEVLFVVEVQIDLKDHHHTERVNLFGIGKALFEPVQIRRDALLAARRVRYVMEATR